MASHGTSKSQTTREKTPQTENTTMDQDFIAQKTPETKRVLESLTGQVLSMFSDTGSYHHGVIARPSGLWNCLQV